MKAKLPNIDKLKSDNARIQQQIDTIKGLKNDPVRYANLLWELTEILPRNTWITSINVEPGTRSVTFGVTALALGGAKPLETIADLMRNVQNSRYFVDATLSGTSQVGSGDSSGYTFQLETHYDENAALKPPEEVPLKGTSPAAAPAPSGTSVPPPGQPGAGKASPAASGTPAATEASGTPGATPKGR